MSDDRANELIASWKRIADQQLMPGGPFRQACEQRVQKDIRFNVRFVTADDDHALRVWELRIIEFLSVYGFDVALEAGVTLFALSDTYLADIDLLIVLPLSDDIKNFATEVAKRQDRASRMLVCIPEDEDGKLYCRLLREQYGVETLSLPREKLLQRQQCRFGVDLVRQCANRLMNKVTASLTQMRVQNTIVILIHGIRTRALWQGEVKQKLEQAGLVAIPTNYNKFDVFRFLLPFERTKRSPLRKVEAEVRSVQKKFPEGTIAILAHSFGTYVVGKLLSNPDNRFSKLAFCGSVIPIDFDFTSAEGRFSHVLNEVGCCDIWPVMASKIGWGYGPTGSFGFNRGNFVQDRKHAKYGHSSFLNGTFCEDFWVPYFCDGSNAVAGDVTAQPSPLVSAIDFVPGMVAKGFFWGGLFILLGLALWAGISWSINRLLDLVG
jgi:hypothetical protein